MPYKKFHLYLEAGEPLNPQKSIVIYNTFLERLANNNIEYPNFSNYSGKNNRITFRADMNNTAFRAATFIAQELMQGKKIIGYKLDEASPDTYVKAAHELASKFAKEIYDNHLDAYNQEKNRDGLNRGLLRFMLYFLKLTFAKIDYDLYITWDKERDFLGDGNREHREGVESIVDSREGLIVSYREHFPNPDFIERFIHLFMNCMLISVVEFEQGDRKIPINLEGMVWESLSKSNTLKSISNSINNGG